MGPKGMSGDPLEPLGWFDECSNDSCSQVIQIFSGTGERVCQIVQEVLADLKRLSTSHRFKIFDHRVVKSNTL